jgi:hypothetical protein
VGERAKLYPIRMKILFSVGSFGFLRNFEPALRLLAEKGHDLH